MPPQVLRRLLLKPVALECVGALELLNLLVGEGASAAILALLHEPNQEGRHSKVSKGINEKVYEGENTGPDSRNSST